MESYTELAAVYDRLMDDFDYPLWADYYLELLSRAGCRPKKLCDCACGTGSMSIEFAKRGMTVTGVDLSRDMLEIASAKARRAAQKILFSAQDMSALVLPRPVDALVCACDGVNYLITDEALDGFFASAAKAIKPDGCLAFDVSSRYKLEHGIGNGFFGEEREDVAYLWANRLDEQTHIVEMDLTFFLRCENGLYRRFEERHRQRAHTPEELSEYLLKNGFTSIQIYGDRTFSAPRPDDKRIHMTAVRMG